LSSQNWFPQIHQLWLNATAVFPQQNNTVMGALTFQPFNALIGTASQQRGGGAMGLTANDPARFILEAAFSWTDPTFDDEVACVSRDFVAQVQQLAKSIPLDPGKPNYYPYYMNDAAGDEDVLDSYKKAPAFAALQKKMDPQGFFRRTGSFHYHT
jgi:hypothetical protein